LAHGAEEKVEKGMADFLLESFEFTRESVLEFWPALDLSTFEAIRDDEEDSDVADQLRQLLWNGDNISPFGQRLLSWSDGDLAQADLLMTMAELNNYLVASVDFYEGLRPASEEFDLPTLSLLEPPAPASLELPAVPLGEPAQTEPEPLTMIELLWEPQPDLVSENPISSAQEPPSVLKLLWETEPLSFDLGSAAEQHSVLPEPDWQGESVEELKVLILGTPPDFPAARPSIEPETAAQANFELEAQAEPEVDAQAEPEVDAQAEPEVDAQAELEVDAQAEPEVDAQAEPEVEAQAEPEVEAQAEPEPPRAGWLSSRSQDPDDEIPLRAKAAPKENDGMEVVAMSAAPLSPLEQKSQLIVKKKYLGYGKNSDGVMGYCGQLTLSRFDDLALNVRLECSNPLLFLSPTSANGKSPVVTYWMPPAAFPQPGGHLTISTPEQNKVLSVGALFPQSRTDFLNRGQVLLLLMAPSVLGLLYFVFVYLLSASAIVTQVKEAFPEAYAAAVAGSTAVDFRSQGVGLYQLEVVPAAESLQLIWAALIWLCPLISCKFFRHLSRSRQRGLGAALACALVLPSLGLFLVWHAQKSVFPLFDHLDFAPLDLRHFLAWSVPLNVLVGSYLFLSVHGLWDRWFTSRELRFGLPVALAGVYLVVAFLLIFGRSWMG
jgi:hypothetical protein